ncbi:MAG: winged helix-turn-helix domain-containing protein [Candidatus Bathyarchaeia archaeon]
MNECGSNHHAKRRDKLYIIAEILEIARNGALKTQIMYRANLSFTQLNEYIKFMLEVNLLDKILEDHREIYKATAKGIAFLQYYHEMIELLKREDVQFKNDVKLPPPHLLKRN